MNSTTKMTTQENHQIGKYPTPPPATWIEEADVSVKKRMIIQQINIFREWCFQNAPDFTAEETLDYVKHVCDINDLNIEIVKEVFDQVESPFYYNIKKDKAVNPEDEYDSSDSEFGEVEVEEQGFIGSDD